jgi:CBS domain-containing protein
VAESPASLASRRPVVCGSGASTEEVAHLLGRSHAGAVVVISSGRVPLGLVTSAELCELAASGGAASNPPASTLMTRGFRTAPPDLKTPEYLAEMMHSRTRMLVLTEDGTAESPLRALLTDGDLAIDCGRNPMLLVAETQTAETVADLAHLRSRTEAFVSEGLAGPSTVEWFSQMIAEINEAVLERVVELAEAEMVRAGWSTPNLGSCWLFFDQAGRGELLTPVAPDLGVVYADPAPEWRSVAEEYFAALSRLVSARLLECGLRPPRRALDVGRGPASRPLSEWKEFYASRIRDPIANAIYTGREYFDFHVACGDTALGAELKRAVAAELEHGDTFIAVMANDTIANLPPLTFYRDHVIEPDGTPRRTLDVEKMALDPIVDAARVFAFAGRDTASASTLRRLEVALKASPQFASVLGDAAEGLRILAYYHALAWRTAPEGDGLLNAARLGRFEQRLLKSAFDMTRRFLDLTYTVYTGGGAK